MLFEADLSDEDGTATASTLAEELAMHPFDHATELPQRIALMLASDRAVRGIVIVFSHTTVDFQATELVLRDLRLLLLRGAVPAPAGPQSADVGIAADTAIRLIARQHRVTGSTALLSAVAGVLAVWSGTDTCGVHTMVNNRALDRYREAITKLNQLALVVVDLSGKPNFAEALPQVWQAAVRAYRHAYFDPAQMAAGFAEAGLPYATGVSPHCYFNDIRLAPADTDLFGRDTTEHGVRESMRRTTFAVGEGMEQFTWRLSIEVLDAPGGIGLALTGDTRYLPPPRTEQFLRAVEGVLVEAAFGAVPWPWACPR